MYIYKLGHVVRKFVKSWSQCQLRSKIRQRVPVAGCTQGNDPAGVDARRHAAATESSDWLERDGDIIQNPLELTTLFQIIINCTLFCVNRVQFWLFRNGR